MKFYTYGFNWPIHISTPIWYTIAINYNFFIKVFAEIGMCALGIDLDIAPIYTMRLLSLWLLHMINLENTCRLTSTYEQYNNIVYRRPTSKMDHIGPLILIHTRQKLKFQQQKKNK